jgi:8-oxo-dGTP diphosphatase
MARTPVTAAGGIVLRQEQTPLIAVVRLRKRDEWVLPKGKLDDGETPRAAAKREVLEETGHDVCVHEFLGTLVYETGGRSKVVHYWRMEAGNKPVRELMHDVRAVDWLPLDSAVERLSRGYERAFLANVGPIALEAVALARTAAARPKAKQSAPEKRRPRRVAPPPPLISEPLPVAPLADSSAPAPDEGTLVVNAATEGQEIETQALEAQALEAQALEVQALGTQASVDANGPEIIVPCAEPDSIAAVVALQSMESGTENPARPARKSLVQKMRDWLRRAA